MQRNSLVTNLLEGIRKKINQSLANKNQKADLSWFKNKYLKHAAAGPLRAYSYFGKKIYYTDPLELLHALKEIFIDEVYAINLPAQPFIIDCGANIGMSVIYLKEKFKDAKIIAFEPDSSSFDLLKKNIQSFGLQNVTARNEAVWIADTQLNFSNEGTMASKIEAGQTTGQTVQAIRLKNLLNHKVDFLKIDIEGAEYAVLKDIQDDLPVVQNMFVEYHGKFNQNNELTELLTIVQNAGFAFYIKEATSVYDKPFVDAQSEPKSDYDVQLNIFCFRTTISRA